MRDSGVTAWPQDNSALRVLLSPADDEGAQQVMFRSGRIFVSHGAGMHKLE